MVEHILSVVTAFAERLLVFVTGRKVADGRTAEVLRLEEVEAAYLGE
jgi:branched-chain amino acid transport system ATP-binding protein